MKQAGPAVAGLIGLLLGTPTAIVAQPQAVQFIEAGGASVAYQVTGLDQRSPGSPIVIFESGAGTPMERWDGLVAELGDRYPVLLYDRPGIGASPWDSVPPMVAHSGAILENLLGRLEIQPPYILVGHSWGGILARNYATTHPQDVIGIVYIDPTEFMRPVEDVQPILREVGVSVPEPEPPPPSEPVQPAEPSPAPVDYRYASIGAVMSFVDSEAWTGQRPAPLEVPTGMIARLPLTDVPQDIVAEAGQDAAERYVTLFHQTLFGKLQDWLPERGQSWFVNAGSVGHFIHDDDPELVAGVIVEVIEASVR